MVSTELTLSVVLIGLRVYFVFLWFFFFKQEKAFEVGTGMEFVCFFFCFFFYYFFFISGYGLVFLRIFSFIPLFHFSPLY